MELYTNEKLLMELSNPKILLTNKRVRYCHRIPNGRFTSLMLPHISSVSVGNTPKKSDFTLIVLLYTTCMAFVYMFEMANIYTLVGIIAIITITEIYLSYIKNQVIITSNNGTTISFDTREIKKEKLSAFINALEKHTIQATYYS